MYNKNYTSSLNISRLLGIEPTARTASIFPTEIISFNWYKHLQKTWQRNTKIGKQLLLYVIPIARQNE